ncbi:multicopper oxidase-domain-containing protein [Cladorrhinum sp. PSN332]|nr:multicopper oxidase-domain-containing protein [Cladorrhinum sp. PSN332]
MLFSSSVAVLLAGVISLTTAAPAHGSTKRASCANTPTARGCWGDFSIDDDPTYTWPDTGVTRSYNFNIGYTTLAPDGVTKQLMTVNGQYPGPTIEANWGDDVHVTVCNNLDVNGTGIHFHGVRQYNSNYADGAASQTECPIAPGDCFTYKWKATQHGSSWYHSHYSLQYSQGILGPIVIHGPKTANYDIDLGPINMEDYYRESVFELSQRPLTRILGIPPVAISGLINGKNTDLLGSGSRHEIVFTPGKKHLLRLVNTGSEITFRFAIDNHSLEVVAVDFVPIVPYTTNSILIAVGQRYDVIVTADKTPSNYWARAQPMLSCLALSLNVANIRAVVRYNSSSTSLPTSLPHIMLDTCSDEHLSSLTPYHPHPVGPSSLTSSYDALLLPSTNSSYAMRWQISNHSISSGPTYSPLKSNPISRQLLSSSPPDSFSSDFVPLDLTPLALNSSSWVYIIISSTLPLPHPIHMHGHDIYILARGLGDFLPGITPINTANPPRRDTINLPQTGYVLLAFQTDNPGAWILHCHIAWHLHDGFAMSIVEGSRSQIRSLYQTGGHDTELERVCTAWEGSGLDSRI